MCAGSIIPISLMRPVTAPLSCGTVTRPQSAAEQYVEGATLHSFASAI